MKICIRIRVMRLMSDKAYAYAYAYGRLYIYGPSGLEKTVNQQVILASKVTRMSREPVNDIS